MNYSTFEMLTGTCWAILKSDGTHGDEFKPRILTSKALEAQLNRLPLAGTKLPLYGASKEPSMDPRFEKKLGLIRSAAGKHLRACLQRLLTMRARAAASLAYRPSVAELQPIVQNFRAVLKIWRRSFDSAAFIPENKDLWSARQRHIMHAMRTGLVVLNLVLPPQYDEWIEECEDFFTRSRRWQLLRYDSPRTYARAARRGTLATMIRRPEEMSIGLVGPERAFYSPLVVLDDKGAAAGASPVAINLGYRGMNPDGTDPFRYVE